MLVQFTMFPADKGESLSPYVARVIELVDSSGLAYKFGPMSTTVEGEWDEVFFLLKRCRDELRKDSNRIYIVISVDDRKDATGRLEGKVRSVEEKLGKKVSG